MAICWVCEAMGRGFKDPVVMLREMKKGMSASEIAEAFQCSVKTVHKKLRDCGVTKFGHGGPRVKDGM